MEKSRLKKIVVTGGSGFIGSHLIDHLLKEGQYEVYNVDNFDQFYDEGIKRENIRGHLEYDTYNLVEVDIRNKEILDIVIPNDTEIIVHLAARAGVRPSIEDPIGYQSVNVTGTQNLLQVAKEKGIEQFVFASSSSVYGKNPNVPWREDDAVLQPISPYASTKVSGELLGHVYSHLYEIRFIALRFFTVYGPRQRPDLAIHKFFDLVDQAKKISIYGDGSTRRDYTYIDDIIQGIKAAISYDGSLFEIVNLGNNKTIKLAELVSTIEKVSGTSANKSFENEQPGDVKQTWADIEKPQRLFNYSPKVGLNEGLEKFYEWFLSKKSLTE